METTDTRQKSNPTDHTSPTRSAAIRRRQRRLYGWFLTLILTGIALGVFIMWYKAWPQKVDCQRTIARIRVAMENYRRDHRKLPPLLDTMELKPGRYRTTHYAYLLEGFGGPATYKDGTVIAHCARPHEGIFHEPGRHMLIFQDRQINFTWISETEFQAIIKDQKAIVPY